MPGPGQCGDAAGDSPAAGLVRYRDRGDAAKHIRETGDGAQRLPAGDSHWLGLAIVVLSVFAFVGLGFFFGARFANCSEDVNGPVAAFGVPLLALGRTWFSTRMLPDFLLKLAWFNPVFHMNEALKAVSGRGAGVGEIGGSLAFLIVFATASLILGVASHHRMLTEEKRT